MEGDWPQLREDVILRPVVRVVKTEVIDDQLVIHLAYGCSHKRLYNLGERGRWVCPETSCIHYVGKANWH
jgi:hypothetical protein